MWGSGKKVWRFIEVCSYGISQLNGIIQITILRDSLTGGKTFFQSHFFMKLQDYFEYLVTNPRIIEIGEVCPLKSYKTDIYKYLGNYGWAAVICIGKKLFRMISFDLSNSLKLARSPCFLIIIKQHNVYILKSFADISIYRCISISFFIYLSQ